MTHSLQTTHPTSARPPLGYPWPSGAADETAGPPAFQCASREEFLARFTQIARHVSVHGYALVEAWDANQQTLKEVSQRFGRVQSHIRADANGLVGISTDAIVNREWENFRSEYHGVSAEEFLPHTDGSYLHGMLHRDGKYIQLQPPGMLVLQCWQRAPAGGANILIDGQRVFADLLASKPRYAEILSTKGCVTYCRDDQIAFNRAVFEKQEDDSFALRFRYDSTAYLADWALEAFHALQRDYWSDPEYEMSVALEEGQILVIDNTRMLHGRQAFSAGDSGKTRSMRRIWLAREDGTVFGNAMDEHRDRRALRRFQAYDILDAADGEVGSPVLTLGIRPSM
jgi:alpha-ketoglutarate-dependent taurine dioxygenase